MKFHQSAYLAIILDHKILLLYISTGIFPQQLKYTLLLLYLAFLIVFTGIIVGPKEYIILFNNAVNDFF